MQVGNQVVLSGLRLLERTHASVQVGQQIVLSHLRLLERCNPVRQVRKTLELALKVCQGGLHLI